MGKRIAAFFDIDGTLYRDSLTIEIFKKLIKYEMIPWEKWLIDVKPYYDKWDKRKGNYDTYLLKMADIYKDVIKNFHSTQVEFIARTIIEQRGERVYTYTRDRIRYHKENGHLVIAISGSPIELVSEMAKKHGFDDFIGTIYKKDENDFYTGELLPMWDSEHKMIAIDGFVDKYEIDLSNSFAYGDTNGDVSMLQRVGNPTIINPTKEVLGNLKDNPYIGDKTNIVVERKDVVYSLKLGDFDIL